MWPAMTALAHTLPYDLRVMGDTVLGGSLPADRWSKVTIPTVVMYRGDSPAWQRNAVRALADVLSDARIGVLEGQTHGFAPEVMAPVLEAFLTA